MKMKKIRNLRPVALAALGVFLGRGAQADTILDFDAYNPPPADQVVGDPVVQSFGDNAVTSSEGVTVSGFGTPNIGVNWGAVGTTDTRWDYYNDTGFYDVWAAGQLNRSRVGDAHDITFAPNSPSARVVVKSFNLHGYYDSTERFTYNVSVLSGTNVLSGPTTFSFLSDGTKNHPVSINYTGALGQTLKLRLARVASTLGVGEVEGGTQNIAADDISFAQLPETLQPVGPQVVSVSPADDTTGLPAVSSPPYLASITNGVTSLVVGSIQLKLDGSPVSPPPIISSESGLTNVSYAGSGGSLTSGDHFYTLIYADNLGAFYTNDVQFSVTFATLPATYALPPGSGVTRGFTYRSVSASTEATNLLNTIVRAKAQLNGTLINPDTSLPYTNSATLGTNADSSFNIDTVLNFLDSGSAGNFFDDQLFPGLDAGPYDWFSTEALLYLDLPVGYYRLGVNSDDGFEVSVLPPQGVPGSPIVLGLFDSGRGADNTLFDFQVETSGIYPFRVIHFEGNISASCEFFSVTNLATGDKVLINDPADGNAIKSYRVLAPRINSAVQNGSNVVIDWAYGTPPFQVQFKSDLSNPIWSNIGSPTANRTANIPIQPGSGFIRVAGQ